MSDRHFLGLSGLNRFAEKAAGAAKRDVCFQLFRTATFEQ
jgi:hypothetical protein